MASLSISLGKKKDAQQYTGNCITSIILEEESSLSLLKLEKFLSQLNI